MKEEYKSEVRKREQKRGESIKKWYFCFWEPSNLTKVPGPRWFRQYLALFSTCFCCQFLITLRFCATVFISEAEVKFSTDRLPPTVTIRIQFPVFVDKVVAAVQPEWCPFTSLILANDKRKTCRTKLSPWLATLECIPGNFMWILNLSWTAKITWTSIAIFIL